MPDEDGVRGSMMEHHRRALREMDDGMFVHALLLAANPMDEELMRQLCLEAADRLAMARGIEIGR